MATNLPDEQPEATSFSTAVGPTLRAARERMGKTVDECAEQLRIRQAFLQALEDSRHKDLPGGTYAVGFLRTYAEFLSLDGEEMVRRFRAESAGDFNTRTELVFPSPVSEGRIPGGAVIFLGVLLAAVAYGGWYWLSTRESKVAEMVPSLPDRLSSLLSRQAALTGEAKPGDAKTGDAKTGDAKGEAARPAGPTEPARTDAARTEAARTDGAGPAEAVRPREEVVPPQEAEEEKAAEKAPAAEPAPAVQPAAATKVEPAAAPKPEPTQAPPQPAKAPEAKPAEPKPAEPKPVDAKPADTAAPAAKPAAALKPAEAKPETPAQAEPAKPAEGAAAGADGKAYGTEHGDARVVLKAVADDCWVQVREMDGSLLLSRLLRKGDSYRVPNRPGLTLMVGNAGALEVSIDGAKGPTLGATGQVKRDIRLDPDKLLAGG